MRAYYPHCLISGEYLSLVFICLYVCLLDVSAAFFPMIRYMLSYLYCNTAFDRNHVNHFRGWRDSLLSYHQTKVGFHSWNIFSNMLMNVIRMNTPLKYGSHPVNTQTLLLIWWFSPAHIKKESFKSDLTHLISLDYFNYVSWGLLFFCSWGDIVLLTSKRKHPSTSLTLISPTLICFPFVALQRRGHTHKLNSFLQGFRN